MVEPYLPFAPIVEPCYVVEALLVLETFEEPFLVVGHLLPFEEPFLVVDHVLPFLLVEDHLYPFLVVEDHQMTFVEASLLADQHMRSVASFL
jgi:hypothetical protein